MTPACGAGSLGANPSGGIFYFSFRVNANEPHCLAQQPPKPAPPNSPGHHPPFCNGLVLRSYHDESTASHPNCEVKHRWARSVLQLGTMWESRVLNGPLLLFIFFYKIFFFEKNKNMLEGHTHAEARTRDLRRVKAAS